MRIRILALGFLLLMLITVRASGDQATEIHRLIQQLGSPRFNEREAASKRLEAIGEPALDALRNAAKTSPDLEVRRRAARATRVVRKLFKLSGRYYLGNGVMRFILEVEAEGRFAFAWTGCPGFNEESNGAAQLVNGWLVLAPDKKRYIPRGFICTPTEFLPVTWGSRTYLLAKDEFLDFCNAINQGTEPRTEPDGLFCLREGDWNTAVQGLPLLPRDWGKYLLQKPLHAEVIEMTDERTGRVNLGETDGVRKGMVFSAVRPRLQPYGLRVVSVEKTSCLVREENELIVPAIKKGDAVTSQTAPRQKEHQHSLLLR